MKPFMDKDFLLTNVTAKLLYHNYAEKMPIVDYHCHINPQEIAQDRKFENITQVWLGGDHYKWRAIRSNGIDEKYITGDASGHDKFIKWAQTLTKAIGNPLYHWTHLELRKYFDYDGVLSEKTAEEVWNLCNEKLKDDSMTVRGIIEQSNVKLICTTDDPVDSLIYHEQIKADPTCKVKVLPAFRPDRAVAIEKPDFADYIKTLGEVSGVEINSIDSLYKALSNRLDFFGEHGCKASDHGVDYVPFVLADENKLDAILKKALNGENVSQTERDAYRTAVLLFLGRQYAKRGWVMQIHYGVLRNNNTKMFEKIGADTGFDTMGTYNCAENIALFLNELDKSDELPKMVLYSINPSDNAVLGSMIGCFQNSDAVGKLQHGSAWWFNDTKSGMEEQIKNLANLSLLGNFIGMLTDSRSFTSYPRHDYFRRILCNVIGQWVENGEYPGDMDTLGKIVEDICYNNTVKYFGFEI